MMSGRPADYENPVDILPDHAERIDLEQVFALRECD
jgi:hypothetical protein